MLKAEKLWLKHRKSEDRNLVEWLNYNQKLTKQDLNARLIVLYNTSGTNISAALYQYSQAPNPPIKSHGFVADAKTYYYYPRSSVEGHYLVAVLNSELVNLAIKEFQPQGLYGERDIHRRPFEICNIPRFDPKNEVHTKISLLGATCEKEIRPYINSLSGSLGNIRMAVRKILSTHLGQIDKLVRKLLEESGQDPAELIRATRIVKNGDLFE
jgi:hypothetical protein